MPHYCTNIPADAAWNGVSIIDKATGSKQAWNGIFTVKGLKYRVQNGEITPFSTPSAPGQGRPDPEKQKIWCQLLQRPDILPNAVLKRALELRTDAIMRKDEQDPVCRLPDTPWTQGTRDILCDDCDLLPPDQFVKLAQRLENE